MERLDESELFGPLIQLPGIGADDLAASNPSHFLEDGIGKKNLIGIVRDDDTVVQCFENGSHLLETLNDGVVITDDSNQILFANAVFEEMTGTPRSEIIGTDARQLYDRAEEFALAQAFYQKALEKERSREEFYLPTKGNGRLPVVVSVRVMRRPEGGRFAILTLTDISEQNRTQEKLRAANARPQDHQRGTEQTLAHAP